MRAAATTVRYVVPECSTRSDGCGPVFELSSLERGKLVVLTLEINCVLEQETLVVSIWGSPDADDWGTKPLVSFPPENYCGLYSILLNLVSHPRIRYLQARWRTERWKNRTEEPMFCFYISVEPSGSRISKRSVRSLGPRRLIRVAG